MNSNTSHTEEQAEGILFCLLSSGSRFDTGCSSSNQPEANGWEKRALGCTRKCKERDKENKKEGFQTGSCRGDEGDAAGCDAVLWFGPALMGWHLTRILNQHPGDLTQQPQGARGPRRRRIKRYILTKGEMMNCSNSLLFRISKIFQILHKTSEDLHNKSGQ